MLASYLNKIPLAKFVLIEDSYEQSGKDLFDYILSYHYNFPNCPIHYFVFEGNFEAKQTGVAHPKINFYDFVTDPKGWLEDDCRKDDFPTLITQLKCQGAVIVIDSLITAILVYGARRIYKTLQHLMEAKGIKRVIALYHQNVMEEEKCFLKCFEHLATLLIMLHPNYTSRNPRVTYVYQHKTGGKVIKKTEEYKFEKGVFISHPLPKIDPKTLIDTQLAATMSEHLSTFRLHLNEEEKMWRKRLVLPYLPKETKSQGRAGELNIQYNFDSRDDYDEQDPDDDLEI